MKHFLWLIINPSKSFDEFIEHPLTNRTIFLIYTIASYFVFLPKIVEVVNNTGELFVLLTYIIVLPFSYFFIYPATYIYKIVALGFNGKIKFSEMKMIIVLSILPIALKTIILLPFVWIKSDISIINYGNYFTQLVFWLLSFRIIIVGIAKYNRFNWMISLIVWAISTTLLATIGYFLNLFKNLYPNPLINNH